MKTYIKLSVLMILLIQSVISFSQNRTKIVMTKSSFYKSGKAKEIVFNKNRKLWELNYANNGWQITDSISYQEDKKNPSVYFATYEDNSKTKIKYTYRYKVSKTQNDIEGQLIQKLNDKYSLSQYYVKDINSIFQSKPGLINKTIDSTKVEANFIPSVFLNYGIPYNEFLISFSYKLSERRIILSDSFCFQNYQVSRKYSYKNNMLSEVRISVYNKETNKLKNHKEIFHLK